MILTPLGCLVFDDTMSAICRSFLDRQPFSRETIMNIKHVQICEDLLVFPCFKKGN